MDLIKFVSLENNCSQSLANVKRKVLSFIASSVNFHSLKCREIGEQREKRMAAVSELFFQSYIKFYIFLRTAKLTGFVSSPSSLLFPLLLLLHRDIQNKVRDIQNKVKHPLCFMLFVLIFRVTLLAFHFFLTFQKGLIKVYLLLECKPNTSF